MRLRARDLRFPALFDLVARVLAVLGALACAQAAAASTLSVTVRALDGQPLAGAVVMAHSLDGSRPSPPVRAVMDQVNLEFVPDLLVIPVGSAVDFPNSDSVSHQIYSFSPARRFQLPLYRGAPYPPVRFDQPGIVTLGCNIHDQMLAHIVVTDATTFGRTNAAGQWTNADVPGGKYRISIWHPRMRDLTEEVEREVTVGEGASAEVEVRLRKVLKPAPIQGRSPKRAY